MRVLFLAPLVGLALARPLDMMLVVLVLAGGIAAGHALFGPRRQ